MYICICVYTCVHIHIYTHIHAHVSTHKSICMYVFYINERERERKRGDQHLKCSKLSSCVHTQMEKKLPNATTTYLFLMISRQSITLYESQTHIHTYTHACCALCVRSTQCTCEKKKNNTFVIENLECDVREVIRTINMAGGLMACDQHKTTLYLSYFRRTFQHLESSSLYFPFYFLGSVYQNYASKWDCTHM